MNRHCFCTLWETDPDLLIADGIPPGFCGLCDLCGTAGHTRHYPGPVPATGAWCDECYTTQAYKGPERMIGARYYNAASQAELIVDEPQLLTLDRLAGWLAALVPPRSALTIELPTERGVDFFVKQAGIVETELSDRRHEVFGDGQLTLHQATQVLAALLAAPDLRPQLEHMQIPLTYYEP